MELKTKTSASTLNNHLHYSSLTIQKSCPVNGYISFETKKTLHGPSTPVTRTSSSASPLMTGFSVKSDSIPPRTTSSSSSSVLTTTTLHSSPPSIRSNRISLALTLTKENSGVRSSESPRGIYSPQLSPPSSEIMMAKEKTWKSGSERNKHKKMTKCLFDLEALIPHIQNHKLRGKVEKTEIVELAVNYLRHLQAHSGSDADLSKCQFMKLSEEDRIREYKRGFNESITQTVKYLTSVEGVTQGNNFCVRLVNHLLAHLESKSSNVIDLIQEDKSASSHHTQCSHPSLRVDTRALLQKTSPEDGLKSNSQTPNEEKLKKVVMTKDQDVQTDEVYITFFKGCQSDTNIPAEQNSLSYTCTKDPFLGISDSSDIHASSTSGSPADVKNRDSIEPLKISKKRQSSESIIPSSDGKEISAPPCKSFKKLIHERYNNSHPRDDEDQHEPKLFRSYSASSPLTSAPDTKNTSESSSTNGSSKLFVSFQTTSCKLNGSVPRRDHESEGRLSSQSLPSSSTTSPSIIACLSSQSPLKSFSSSAHLTSATSVGANMSRNGYGMLNPIKEGQQRQQHNIVYQSVKHASTSNNSTNSNHNSYPKVPPAVPVRGSSTSGLNPQLDNSTGPRAINSYANQCFKSIALNNTYPSSSTSSSSSHSVSPPEKNASNMIRNICHNQIQSSPSPSGPSNQIVSFGLHPSGNHYIPFSVSAQEFWIRDKNLINYPPASSSASSSSSSTHKRLYPVNIMVDFSKEYMRNPFHNNYYPQSQSLSGSSHNSATGHYDTSLNHDTNIYNSNGHVYQRVSNYPVPVHHPNCFKCSQTSGRSSRTSSMSSEESSSHYQPIVSKGQQ